MAEAIRQPPATTPAFSKLLTGFTALPMQRQLGLLIGLAMLVALVAGVAMWGIQPTYRPLLPGMAKRDVAEAMGVLSKQGIDYHINADTGALMVPAKKVQKARLYLATAGLPHQDGVGFELLDKKSGIGMSRLEETVRYQRALEGELARTVEALNGVDSARVHLAIPRDTVFLNNDSQPAASVLIDLHPGRTVDQRQIAGIVHLIASSVPKLDADHVTVVDQRGRLLTTPNPNSTVELSSRQLDYTHALEGTLRKRVESILAPVVGKDGVRVQVTAQVSFRQVERTHEAYNPDNSVVRSEQITVDKQAGNGGPQGVPGALSNEPPAGATVALTATADEPQAAPNAAGASVAGGAEANPPPVDSHRSTTRNYEVDRTISHVTEEPASLQRLSVAVVVDNQRSVDADGKPVSEPRTKEQMQHLTALVKKAVGFSAARGDSVNVVNAPFQQTADAFEPLPPKPWWKLAWAQDLVKQALAGLGVLLLVLLVLRPTLKSLAQPQLLPVAQPALAGPDGDESPDEGASPEVAMEQKKTLEGGLDQARQLTQDDPRMVAQVVRNWMQSDG